MPAVVIAFMAGVRSGRCLFQTVAHEFSIGGTALHAGLGLVVGAPLEQLHKSCRATRWNAEYDRPEQD